VDLYVDAKVSEEHTASIFRAETHVVAIQKIDIDIFTVV
jgi:hypothetical protein